MADRQPLNVAGHTVSISAMMRTAVPWATRLRDKHRGVKARATASALQRLGLLLYVWRPSSAGAHVRDAHDGSPGSDKVPVFFQTHMPERRKPHSSNDKLMVVRRSRYRTRLPNNTSQTPSEEDGTRRSASALLSFIRM